MTNEDVKKSLEEIAAKNDGVLRPEDVVTAARDPKHPLHAKFVWDDAKAAEAHRLQQARTIIRSVRVNITTTTRKITAVYYTRDPRAKNDESGYLSLPRLRSELTLAKEAITAEFARAEAALTRARDQALAVDLPKEAKLADDLIRQLHGGDEALAVVDDAAARV